MLLRFKAEPKIKYTCETTIYQIIRNKDLYAEPKGEFATTTPIFLKETPISCNILGCSHVHFAKKCIPAVHTNFHLQGHPLKTTVFRACFNS